MPSYAWAARLPASQADELVRTAQAAFVHGLRAVAIAGAVLLVVAAIATRALLRDVTKQPASPPA